MCTRTLNVKSDSLSHVFDIPTLISSWPLIKTVDAYKSRQAMIFHSILNLQGGGKCHAISKTSSQRKSKQLNKCPDVQKIAVHCKDQFVKIHCFHSQCSSISYHTLKKNRSNHIILRSNSHY